MYITYEFEYINERARMLFKSSHNNINTVEENQAIRRILKKNNNAQTVN